MHLSLIRTLLGSADRTAPNASTRCCPALARPPTPYYGPLAFFRLCQTPGTPVLSPQSCLPVPVKFYASMHASWHVDCASMRALWHEPLDVNPSSVLAHMRSVVERRRHTSPRPIHRGGEGAGWHHQRKRATEPSGQANGRKRNRESVAASAAANRATAAASARGLGVRMCRRSR